MRNAVDRGLVEVVLVAARVQRRGAWEVLVMASEFRSDSAWIAGGGQFQR